jgi:hypothetical protein
VADQIQNHESNQTVDDWPFADPLNVLTLTLRQIMFEGTPILLVCHDADDGMWQFLTGDSALTEDALLVCLKNVVAHDKSICELADLPLGWQATRASSAEPWRRSPASG